MTLVVQTWIICGVQTFYHENCLRFSSVSFCTSVKSHWKTTGWPQTFPDYVKPLQAIPNSVQTLPCQENSIPRHTISFIGFLCLPVSIIIVFCVPGRVITLVTYSVEIVFLNWHNLHKHLKSKDAQYCSWLWRVWSLLLQNCHTPKSYFPGTPGFQQNRRLSLQLKFRNECFHFLKRKK